MDLAGELLGEKMGRFWNRSGQSRSRIVTDSRLDLKLEYLA